MCTLVDNTNTTVVEAVFAWAEWSIHVGKLGNCSLKLPPKPCCLPGETLQEELARLSSGNPWHGLAPASSKLKTCYHCAPLSPPALGCSAHWKPGEIENGVSLEISASKRADGHLGGWLATGHHRKSPCSSRDRTTSGTHFISRKLEGGGRRGLTDVTSVWALTFANL